MIKGVIGHASRHSIAYLALVCSLLALGGASYAAIHIPNGSVGEKQIKNHVIDPVKWDRTYVTGFVRRWANVGASGNLINSAPNGQSAQIGQNSGNYDVTWEDQFASFCTPLATVESGQGSSGGYATVALIEQANNATLVNVTTYNHQGQQTPEPFYLGVICPPGAGGGQLFQYTLP